ncbi:MAG: hypothetical protein QOH65_3259 [Methylobacteriaceae bacterium]|jgi:multidrug resistance efflux pump|nr:hypothetical protein [Methylobacteriaceae bacterium]
MDGSQLVGHARTVDDIATKQTGRSRWSVKRLLIAALVLALLAAAAIYGHCYWTTSRFLAPVDPRDYQTALDQARANVAVAQASTNASRR